jgi:hypothetical protein
MFVLGATGMAQIDVLLCILMREVDVVQSLSKMVWA